MILKCSLLFFYLLLFSLTSYGATIAIIDTGFDLDHDFLKPKVLQKETDEEAIDFYGWDFFDNSHLKTPVITDKSSIQEILLYRNLRAKGHQQGLSLQEFEWYKKRNSDKEFMEKVKLFKKHSHGTFVAGIALREGENINIFPIRGLNLPVPVVAVEDSTSQNKEPLKGKTPQEKFQEEIRNSLNRVSQKFSKICRFVSQQKIEVVNASYGITYKHLVTKIKEQHRTFLNKEIEDSKLKSMVNDYFNTLYKRGEKTMRKYPNIMFIFSAGNSGLNNDEFHHYPSKIKVPNAMTIAAMNGDYLASFSNYGISSVDIGAPGVAILSLVPKIYSQNGVDLYSPSSGTSMAAPYVSNLVAQVINTNPRLSPQEVKRIILETGDAKNLLKDRLASGRIVNNERALKVAFLSREIPIEQALNLAESNLISIEDKINIGLPPAISPEDVQKKILNSIPEFYTQDDLDEDQGEFPSTKQESSSPKDQEKVQPGNSPQLPLKDSAELNQASDLSPSNQTPTQSPPPSEETPASSSPPQSTPVETQDLTPSPSSP